MIEAMIQTGTFETPYRRAGTGPTVLLLSRPGGPAERLFPLLAERFRVIQPDTHDLQALTADWLQGIIDGLGLQAPAIVADAALAATLLRFAMMDPDRVGRLAIVDTETPQEPAPDGGAPVLASAAASETAALDALSVAGHALLVARSPSDPSSPAAQVLWRELMLFLDAAGQPAPRSVS